MATSCTSNKTVIPAQTLFLGASVADFSLNMGWGGQASQLSVTLVEDGNPFMCRQTMTGGSATGPLIDPIVVNQGNFAADDHYHTCTSDTLCYMDESGKAYNPNHNPPSQEKIVPGKVYYAWTAKKGFVSRYWRHQDPGFFGYKSSIDISGTYNTNSYNTSQGFDIINTPVFFKIGEFTFSGIVQSWEREIGSGGLTYRVNIESIDSLLSNSYIILGGYAGSIFSKLSGATYGGPKNYTGTDLIYNGKLIEGNLANVFNVYGFLESMGPEKFGGSYRNDNGISAKSVIDALLVLTSSDSSVSNDPAHTLVQEQKKAFSPFGRILLKTAQENNTYTRMSPSHAYPMGLIPPTLDLDGVERCHFTLDLSELPIPPDDYRISDSILSIMDFISNVCEASGVDFYFDMLVVPYQSKPLNIIKVRTVNRRTQPAPGQIQSTIDRFVESGFPMSAANLGKEKSDSSPRVLCIGGKQQRLYQAKSYRLGFARANYVWNPVSRTFVDFTSYDFGKIRMPCGYSTRNTTLSNDINGTVFTALFDADEEIKKKFTQLAFDDDDMDWADPNLSDKVLSGNYLKTQSIKRKNTTTFNRFFPLFQDVICPFFGFQMSETIPANTSTTDNNDFRIVRPVYLDTWTGQIVFVISVSDLPTNLNVPLVSLYNNNQLIISETEMRAAMGDGGIDSYLSYGLGKIFKPDLILMLIRAYSSRGIPMTGVGEDDAGFLRFPTLSKAFNISNEMGAPGPAAPQPTSNDINFDLFLNPNLVKDLNTLVNFIADLGNTYYGKQYLVRVPELVSYRDYQYSNFQIPVGDETISVFRGTGKLHYNYDPINEAAWEEPGNVIDDNILVGSPKYYTLCEEDGRIGPILGYNFSDSFDYVSRALCGLNVLSQAAYYEKQLNSTPEGDKWRNGTIRYDMKVLLDAAKAGACDDSKFYFLSLDLSSLSASDYLVVDSTIALKGPYEAAAAAFGPLVNPIENSKKIYVKANVHEDIIYLKPRVMEEPRVLITTSNNLNLATTSYAYQTDPNRTVVSNIAIEDLLLYLKYTPPSQYDNNFIRFMAHYMSPIIGNTTLLVNGFSTSNSVQHAMLAPKAAHPYFAGIPVRSNQYTYGPWTNYPSLTKLDIFPGLDEAAASQAVENLIGGVSVKIEPDYVPWNYGSISLLDSVVLGEIQANTNYQQITETARIDTIGLPVLGLGSPFIYNSGVIKPGSVLVNNQEFIPRVIDLAYDQQRYEANQNPLENIPIIGEVIVSPNIPSRKEQITKLNYKIIALDAAYRNSIAPIISNIQCSISPQQVRTTYNFRTHTRKLGLFNKENADRIRKFASANTKRNRELATQANKLINRINKERQDRLHSIKNSNSSYGSKNLRSGLYGTSPTEIMCGRAYPFLNMPIAIKKNIENIRTEIKNNKKNKNPEANESRTGQASVVPFTLSMTYGRDPGENEEEKNLYAAPNTSNQPFADAQNPTRASIRNNRWSTYVGMYQSKEAPADLVREYSLKSAMSLDGIFSPVSFYPTKFYSTYPLQKYQQHTCPYCNKTGVIKDSAYNNVGIIQMVEYQCPYCVGRKDGLATTATTTASAQSLEILPPYIVTNRKDINVITEFGSSSSVSSASNTSSNTNSGGGQEIAINLVSLQPIVVPYGEFRNYNAGEKDKCRHSIEVVAHGEIPPQKGWGINTRVNMGKFIKTDGNMQSDDELGQGYNADYFHKDLLNTDDKTKLNNQRFFGLRGPIVYHAWGYDLEGFPTPNAADEPKEVDQYGRPKRFVLKESVDQTNIKFKELKNKEIFVLADQYVANKKLWEQDYYYKVPNMSITIGNNIIKIGDDINVYRCKLENDMEKEGSFTGPNLGDIISKTQNWENNKWTEKKKLKEFYRNWAEHPNLWKVGPIDLRWDENRQVWTTKSSDAMTIYKMVYVTLEEDLTKSQDYDETYPARGFLDDLEYSSEKLPANARRLVFVKDRGGYTAPRGAKLLCRYDKDSGFYEPVSKQTFVVGGMVGSGNSATIEMSYIQGRKKGEVVPTSNITFDDPFSFAPRSGQKGLFTFINGLWTLTAAKPN